MKEVCQMCLQDFNRNDMIESGGQFCGGTWYVCKACNEKSEEQSKILNKILAMIQKSVV